MDMKTLLDKLREHLVCPVCMSICTLPKKLPCMHSFCLQCLNNILRTRERKDIVPCPECRREFKVPVSGNLNELPSDFNLNSLIDSLPIEECSKISVKCGNCDKENSKSFYCFNCREVWCEDCKNGHDLNRANNEHRVLAIQNFEDRDAEAVLKRPEFCPKKSHEREELRYLCRDCNVAICNACAELTHGEGHEKILLEEAVKESKMQIESVLITQKQSTVEKTRKMNEISQNCITIQQEVLNAKQSVQNFVDNLKEVIEAKKQETFRIVDKQAEESLNRLENKKREVEIDLRLTEKAIERNESLLKRSTNVEIVQLDKALLVEEVRVKPEQPECVLNTFWHVVVKENQTLMQVLESSGIGSIHSFLSRTDSRKSTAEGIGTSEATVGLEAEVSVTTKNSKGEVVHEESDLITMEFKTFDCENLDGVSKPRITNVKDGIYKVTYCAKKTGAYQASMKVNGEHIHGSPFEIEIKPREFRHLLSIGHFGSSVGEMNKPWGLAVNGRNEIAVCDAQNNRVQVFSSEGTYLRTIGGGEFHFPNGIALDSDENIFVADCSNHRINKFDRYGKYLGQIGCKGRLDGQLWNPRGVSIDSNGNVIVADAGNQEIKIFSPGGEILRKFGREGGLLVKPYDAIEKLGKVFVSDTGDHSVKAFDMDGNFLFKFGGEGEGDGQFNQPRGLSFDKSGHLVVCDSKNDRVQFFEVDGTFVSKFGSEGRFHKPMNAAFLSDGRIVVSDLYHHAIHLFQ